MHKKIMLQYYILKTQTYYCLFSFPRRVITASLFLQNESRKHIAVNFEIHRAVHYH